MKRLRSWRVGTVLLLAVTLTLLSACGTVDAPGRGDGTGTTGSVTAAAGQTETTVQSTAPPDAELTIYTTDRTPLSGTDTADDENNVSTLPIESVTSDSEATELPSAHPETSSSGTETITESAAETSETAATAATEPVTVESEPFSTEPSISKEPAAQETESTGSTTGIPTASETASETAPSDITEGTGNTQTSESSNVSGTPEETDSTDALDWLDNLGEFLSGVNGLNNGSAGRPGSRHVPVELGETASFDGSATLFDRYQAELQVTEVLRGEPAADLIQMASALNPSPQDGYEYLVARIEICVTEQPDSKPIDIGPYSFTLVSEDGDPYPGALLIRSPEPAFKPFSNSEPQSAYVVFQTAPDDANPSIVFLARNFGGLWLETAEASDSD